MKDDQNHHSTASKQEMGALIVAYRQSGLSLKDFARKHGMPPGRLHYWIYEKNRNVRARSLARRAPLMARAVFEEVKLEPGCALLQSWAAEVSLAQGLSVRFSGTANPAWMGAVVQSLQRPC